MQKWFITGTDTDVGKTHVGQLIMQGLALSGKSVIGYKPISAGCELINGQLVNDDASQYQVNSTIDVPLSLINPIAYAPPIAPHIAAQQQGETLSFAAIASGLDRLAELNPDIVVTEGAGGWRLPMGDGTFLSEFPINQNMQIILVVGLRLGCLNHAVLTAQAIMADGGQFGGWIGNHIDPDMDNQQDNIDTLTAHLGKPLGIIPHGKTLNDADKAALVAKLL